MSEVEILKQAIVALIDVEMGIYPAAIIGRYEKRSDHQEGWNACYTAYIDKMIKVLDELGIHVSMDGIVTVQPKEVPLLTHAINPNGEQFP